MSSDLPIKVESVRDRSSCKAWVAALSTNDSTQTLAHIDALLSHLSRQKFAPEVLLDILERLRSPFSSAVRIRMPECENRALPLSPREAELFLDLISTTQHLCDLYVTAAESAGGSYVENLAAPIERTSEGERAIAPDSPIVFALQQALDLLASIASAHYRARIAVPENVWNEIARLARIAQQADCLDMVPTSVRNGTASSSSKEDTCRSAFGYAVMMRLCNPYRMNFLEMSVARYCSIRWSHKLGFKVYPPDTPATQSGTGTLMLGQHVVRLDTMRMCSSVRMRMESLRTGKMPNQLGFSSKLSVESCYAVLERIQTLWSHGQDSEIIWRRPANTKARIVLGLPKLYRSSATNDDTMKRFLNTVYSYRQKSPDLNAIEYTDQDRVREQVEGMMKEAELWDILSENADGFLLLRDRSMPRVVLDQLVTLLPQAEASDMPAPFLLGSVSSLKQEYDTQQPRLSVRHKVGVKLLAGLPKPVGVQIDGAPTTDAYWLEAQPALMLPESLVLPLAAFREDREIFMISAGHRMRLRLDTLLHRGTDFDQVIFTQLR